MVVVAVVLSAAVPIASSSGSIGFTVYLKMSYILGAKTQKISQHVVHSQNLFFPWQVQTVIASDGHVSRSQI